MKFLTPGDCARWQGRLRALVDQYAYAHLRRQPVLTECTLRDLAAEIEELRVAHGLK